MSGAIIILSRGMGKPMYRLSPVAVLWGGDEGERALAGVMLAHVVYTALCMCMPASYSELVTEMDNYKKIFSNSREVY